MLLVILILRWREDEWIRRRQLRSLMIGIGFFCFELDGIEAMSSWASCPKLPIHGKIIIAGLCKLLAS